MRDTIFQVCCSQKNQPTQNGHVATVKSFYHREAAWQNIRNRNYLRTSQGRAVQKETNERKGPEEYRGGGQKPRVRVTGCLPLEEERGIMTYQAIKG